MQHTLLSAFCVCNIACCGWVGLHVSGICVWCSGHEVWVLVIICKIYNLNTLILQVHMSSCSDVAAPTSATPHYHDVQTGQPAGCSMQVMNIATVLFCVLCAKYWNA